MIRNLLLLFTVVVITPSKGQKLPVLVDQYPYKAERIIADKVGHLYLLHNDEVIKINKDGKELNRYSNKVFGEITYFDISSPLKPLIWYQNQRQVIFTDNRLSPRQDQLSLEEMGYTQTSLVCYSYMNGLWIYDQVELGLVRFDVNFEKTVETGNLNQILNKELNPNYMVERYNKLYLNDPQHGILVFDAYGNYLKTIPLTGLNYFHVLENLIYYPKDRSLVIYDQVGMVEQNIALPPVEIIDALFYQDELWIVSKSTVYKYVYK